MSTEVEIIEWDSWPQYACSRQAFTDNQGYAVLYHTSGCKDCDAFISRWREAIKMRKERPVLIEFYTGSMDELREEGNPVKRELEKMTGKASVPTLAIFHGKQVLETYPCQGLIDKSAEEIGNILYDVYTHAEAHKGAIAITERLEEIRRDTERELMEVALDLTELHQRVGLEAIRFAKAHPEIYPQVERGFQCLLRNPKGGPERRGLDNTEIKKSYHSFQEGKPPSAELE